jgi:hypothetical protein
MSKYIAKIFVVLYTNVDLRFKCVLEYFHRRDAIESYSTMNMLL